MNAWKSLAGMMDVVITCASPEDTLWNISSNNIPIFTVKSVGNLTIGFRIYRKDYQSLNKICRKRGETLEIQRRSGIYWTTAKMIRRPVLTIGMLCILLSVFLLPRHILFIEVTGNRELPANRVVEAAEECGIRFGASRGRVRSEQVKNSLLSMLKELQWAGVNTRGCVATISVRERTETEQIQKKNSVSNIVAARDGIIVDCTAIQGTLLCSPGQAVKSGELLISGYTDCGITIQATEAQGEVFAQTIRKLEAVIPIQWTEKTLQQKQLGGISLLIGKKRINLWKDSGIWDTTCGRIYSEYYVTLPGDYRLPLALCIDAHTICQVTPFSISLQEAEVVFADFENRVLPKQMVAGEVLHEDRLVNTGNDVYHMQGSYVCREMIGTVRAEKIGEAYGQTD